MAVNLASKFAQAVDERIKQAALTKIPGLCNDYEWNGVQTVTVYNVDTVALTNYTRTGSDRYGTPTELGNGKTDYTLTQDKSFTFTIDKGNKLQTNGAMEAGKALRREIDEIVIPTLDKYNLSIWGATTNTTGTPAAITKANAYETFLTAQEVLDNKSIPMTGRIMFCSNNFKKCIKLDPNFVLASEIMAEKRINGQFGEIDGVKVIPVPSSYLPAKTEFILLHPMCSCTPNQLEDYKTHQDPPGISGMLIEGRLIYDCFVLSQKTGCIVKHLNAA